MTPLSQGKILVVGGGIAGLTAAWALARRGFEVEVFDQGQIPNPRGASYDENRIIRHAYGEAGGYARLIPAAFAAYERLFQDIGARPFEPAPLLALRREAAVGWFDASLVSLEEMGIGVERLDPGMVAVRFPMIETAGLTGAFLSEGAGILYPTRILLALSVHLAARGVRLHPAAPVETVDVEQACLTARGERHAGDAVVIAAGAWVSRLLPAFAGIAVPSGQAVIYLSPPPGLAQAWSTAPVVIDFGQQGGAYVLPPRPGTRLKLGDHALTRTGDPDGGRDPAHEQILDLMEVASRSLRDFGRYRVLERKLCFYAVTADDAFIVAPAGAKGYVVSACSGHGFKFAPLIAEGLAAAITGERPRDDVAAWAAGRSRDQAPPA